MSETVELNINLPQLLVNEVQDFIAFYAIAFRKKLYSSIEQLQQDLDDWMHDYNINRTHTGRFCFRKTPMETFIASVHIAKEHYLEKLSKTKNPDQADIQKSVGAGEDSLFVQQKSLNSQQISDNL